MTPASAPDRGVARGRRERGIGSSTIARSHRAEGDPHAGEGRQEDGGLSGSGQHDATPRHAARSKPSPKATAKKAPAKKTPAKKAPAKKTTAKKAPAKKKTVKKAPVKKTTAKKGPAKKKTVKKATSPRPVPAKKTSAKPTVAKKVPAKPVPAPAKAAAAARVAAPAKTASGVAPRPSILEGKTKHGKNTVICPLSGFEVTPGPANLGAKTLGRLRQKLIDEKQRLGHQAEDLTAEAEQLAREREAGDTQFDEESGEGDTVNVERERDLLLSATARQVVDEIDDALDRIKRNKYGVCKPAGRRIALERLEAIPWAQVCVDCKARAERRR